MHACMDGWMDGWMYVCMYVCMYVYVCVCVHGQLIHTRTFLHTKSLDPVSRVRKPEAPSLYKALEELQKSLEKRRKASINLETYTLNPKPIQP